jgi:two-component system, OmpR family, response regulator
MRTTEGSSVVRVFVVEDSQQLQERIINDLVAIRCVRIVGFTDAEVPALTSIARLRPDIIVTDLQLKEGSGIELIREVRARDYAPNPRIFVLSNYSYRECRARCLDVGADEFFDKSSEYDRFLATMHGTANQMIPA